MGGVYLSDIKLRRKLFLDNKGALEGLPLYLIIMVVIAAVSIVIIFSYLSMLQTIELERLEVYIDGEKSKFATPGNHEVYIIAIGSDGNKLEDVTVTLTGNDINRARVTDSNGKADFGMISFTSSGVPYTVDVEGSYSSGNVNIPIDEKITISY
jgi:hypothetical protein